MEHTEADAVAAERMGRGDLPHSLMDAPFETMEWTVNVTTDSVDANPGDSLCADANGGGLVVNVSSLAGRMAGGSNIAYCASKAGLDNMTLSLARALAPEIRVVSVAPGLVDTEFTKAWDPEVTKRTLLTPNP